MSLLAQGQRWSCLSAIAALACTTYAEPPSGAPGEQGGSAPTGGQAGGGSIEGGKASGGKPSGAGSGGTAAISGSANGGTTGDAGSFDPGEAGAAACLEGDCCPDDALKTEPGACGCGVADADSDTDGTLDCQDACPDDANKTDLGVCGCGLPEQDTAELASCSGLKAALIHRYDFEGGGKMVQDRVGTAHGTVEGVADQTVVAGKGVLALVGNAAYVNLPNFLISQLSSVTLESWVTWNGGKAWQRVFDFGESTAMPPEDASTGGKDYLFLTPMAAGLGSRFGFSLNGSGNETGVNLPTPLAATISHVVAVVDTTANKMIYYRDGASGGEVPFTAALSSINDVNVWLGRSQYGNDPAFTGTYHEFRIYDKALTDKEVATSFAAGPDPSFLAPP